MTHSAQDAYAKAVRLSSKYKENFVELAYLLRQLLAEDKQLFKTMCAGTGLGERKAYYLAEIGKRIEGLPVPKETLAKVGWTKMQVIGKLLTDWNWQEMLAVAEVRTTRELRVVAKGLRPTPGMKTVVLYLNPGQHEKFTKAILANGGKAKGAGLKNVERALMNVIAKAGVAS